MNQHDRIFAKSSNEVLTYKDLDLFCQYLLHTFKSKTGISTPLVALQTESKITTVQLIAAFWLTNIPFIAIPENLTDEEIYSYLKDLNPDIIIGNEIFLIDVKKTNPSIPSIESASIIFEDSNSQKSNRDIKNSPFLSNHGDFINQIQCNSNDSIFAYLFTSGTTNHPKCVPITRAQILAAAESTRKNLPIQKSDQWLLSIPLNHIGGISIITRTLIIGSSLRYIPKFDSKIVSKILSDDTEVTFCSLVSTQLQKVLVDSTLKVHSKFKCILLGGGPITESLIESTRSINIPVIPSFGMTETTAQCIAVPFSEMYNAPPNSCGKPLQGVEIEIRFDKNDEKATQNLGTLWVRGPQIIKQYLNPAHNHVLDQNGWFNTEDYCEIDENGFVRIIMRRTDRIVTGGENVNPIEVENLLLQMPGLTEVAIIGIPDDIWGQKLTAVISHPITHQSVSIDSIKKFLSKKTASFKIPKELIIVDSIPRTGTGKIKRSTLLELIQNTK